MRTSRGDDEGSALVAAVGVAIIGIALCMVVVWQAVVVTQDAARDSVRTSEVHAAEAAVDTVIERLNVSNPCPTVSYNDVAQGTVAVNVVVAIQYADASGPLNDCNGGVIQGTPTRATITATATPVHATSAVQPERTVQASVQLKPRAGHSAAIYSATQPQTGAGFSLGPLIPTDTANVWVDSGNFLCNQSVGIEGDLTVVAGGVTMNQDCYVTGAMWVRDSVRVNTQYAGYRVGDGLTIKNGDLQLENSGLKFRGDVIVGGAVTGSFKDNFTVTDGGVYEHQSVAATTPIGLPVVGVVPSDWAGMTFKNKDGFKQDMLNGAFVGGMPSWAESNLDGCTLASWMANSAPGGVVTIRPPANTAYDLSGASGAKCSSDTLTLQNTRFELSGDLVIFAKTFQASNPISVVSADGNPHNIWLIVPNDEHPSMPAGYSDSGGGIHFHSAGNTFLDPIRVFLYSPGTIDFYNSTSTIGQIYANQVNVHPTSTFKYTPIGIPGVDLSTTHAVGSDVTIESKLETS